MKPEILAKIMGIIAKGKERVIVIDPASNAAFAILGLDEYEKLVSQGNGSAGSGAKAGQLTQKIESGMIDPDLAIWQEAKRAAQGDWGGDEGKEEDRYYMEPTE